MRSMFSTVANVLQQVPKTVGNVLAGSGVQPTNTSVIGLKIFHPLLYSLVTAAINDLAKNIPQGLGSALQDAPFWERFARTFKFVDGGVYAVEFQVDATTVWHALDGDPYQYQHWLEVLLWMITSVKPALVNPLLQAFQTFTTQLTGFLITWGEQVYDYIVSSFLPYNYPTNYPNVPFISLIYAIVSPVTAQNPIMVPIGILYGAIADLWNPTVCASNTSSFVPITLYLFSFYFLGPQINGSGLYTPQWFRYTNYQGTIIGYNYNGITYYYWTNVVYFGYKNSYLSSYGSGLTTFLLNTWLSEGVPYEIYNASGSAPANWYNFAPNPITALFQSFYTLRGTLNINGPNAPNNMFVVETAVGPLNYQAVVTSTSPITFNITVNRSVSPISGMCSNITSLTLYAYVGADWWLGTSLAVSSSGLPSGIGTVYSGINLIISLIAANPFEEWYYTLTNNILTLSDITKYFPPLVVPTVRPVVYDFSESISDLLLSFFVFQGGANGVSFTGFTTTQVPSNNTFPAMLLTSPEIELSGNFKTINATVGTSNLYGIYIDAGSGPYNGLGKALFTAISTVNPLGGSLAMVITSLSTEAVVRPDFYVAEEGHFAPVSPQDLTSQYNPSGYYINTPNAIFLSEGTYTLDVTAVDSNNNVIYNGSLSVQAQKPILYVPNGYGYYTSTGLVYTEFVPQVLTPTQQSKPSPVLAIAGVLLLTLIGYFGSMRK